ncbi:MAG: SH3 domain-containing protein [Syntrophales bacterium]|nr:SH3 domain-containing protein [Syntrophales bacterium]
MSGLSTSRQAFLFVTMLIILASTGCSNFGASELRDISFYPQHTAAYLEYAPRRLLADEKFLASSAAKYVNHYFSPWDESAEIPCLSKLLETVERAQADPGYAENRRSHDARWIESVVNEMNLDEYPSLSILAVTLRETDVRGIPTERPRFLSFSHAGGGFPFDYWQESILFPNTPLRILHSTLTGDWLYVHAPFVNGWVRSRDLGIIEKADLDLYRSGNFIVPLRDRVAIHDEEGRFLFRSRIGGLYPLAAIDDRGYRVLAMIPGSDSAAMLQSATLSFDDFAPFPLSMTPPRIAEIADAMSGSPYGWGGLYGNRDCSAFLRDLFAGFGLWLPRNSYQQAHEKDEFIRLDNLTPVEKEQFIIQNAIPFATILWMPGHVLLYIGERQGRAMAAHVMWGLRTRTWRGEGRIIVGEMAVTTLTPGSELPQVRGEYHIINRIGGMRRLVPWTE